MLPKQKGDMALGRAINYFLTNSYEVCLPIGDKRDYDLVIEKDGLLSRVQVKYGGVYNEPSKCPVGARVNGGHQSFHYPQKNKAHAFPLFFVYNSQGETNFFALDASV